MYGDPMAFCPKEIARPAPLGGYSGGLDQTTFKRKDAPVPAGIIHATEEVLAYVETLKVGFPILADLYLNGDATGSGKLHFFVKANDVVIADWYASRYRTVGQDGRPQRVMLNLPIGATIKITCKNEDAADDTLQAECDGTIIFCEKPV